MTVFSEGAIINIVKISNLTKVYRKGQIKVVALNDISLEVKKGEFLAVMGPSGSGKSTLLHLLGALEDVTDGQILVNSKDFTSLKDKQLTLLRRKDVSFVFQFFNLLPILTVEENIVLPLLIAGKRKKHYMEKLNKLLKMADIEKRRNHLPEEISGGEQQKAAVARALITEPSIMLVDEPTGNLDTSNSLLILKLLKESAQKLEQTIIMVTHDPKTAAFAQKVVFLKDGKNIKELSLIGGNNKEKKIINTMQKLSL